MSTDTRNLTAEDLWLLPKVDRLYELVCGELITLPLVGFEHGRISAQTAAKLFNFARQHYLGVVVGADCGFVLRRNPDTVRAPSAAFVKQARIPEPIPITFWEGAPDLAVEVLSPSDTATEIDDKVQEYLDAGTTEALVINPKTRSVKIVRHGNSITLLRSGDVLENLESVPGFRCTVDEIFE